MKPKPAKAARATAYNKAASQLIKAAVRKTVPRSYRLNPNVDAVIKLCAVSLGLSEASFVQISVVLQAREILSWGHRLELIAASVANQRPEIESYLRTAKDSVLQTVRRRLAAK